MPRQPTLLARALERVRPWLLGLLAGGLALTAAACESAGSAPTVTDPLTGPVNPGTDYSFLSAPDFLNADIGDLTSLPSHRPGTPNSTSASIEQGLQIVTSTWQSEDVRDMFVAGDLVEGHWGVDTTRSGVFGPVRTQAQRRAAIVRAGDFYYSQWLQRFAGIGMTTYPALGDHDIGDNNWGPAFGSYPRFKLRNIGVFKHTFASNVLQQPDGTPRFADHPASGPARETAYAVRPDPEVQLVSLDVFKRGSKTVRMSLDDAQLAWLAQVLQKAVDDGVDWIIVQGHVPILTPVREIGSSGLTYQGGPDSALWQLFEKYHVDMYLCGEVHAVTMRQLGGVTQLCHGGLFVYGFSNYVRADINGGTMTITSKRFHGLPDKTTDLWQTDGHKHLPEVVTYDPDVRVTGAMTLTSDNHVLATSGLLAPYSP
ncbi:MAG: metallophosphoesterase [Nocardioidaceae bacterium]